MEPDRALNACNLGFIRSVPPPQVGMYKVHPPVPSSLSAEAQAFLLRTFEPDPCLRASAQELLDDPFLQPGKRSCSPGSPRYTPQPPGALRVEEVNTVEGKGAELVGRLINGLSLPQVPLPLTPVLQLTQPPSLRHFRDPKHPLSTHSVRQSAALVMGTLASSGECLGSWNGFPSSGFAFLFVSSRKGLPESRTP